MAQRRQLFLSHAWGPGAKTHGTVVRIADQLRGKGWTVWLDATDLLGGNIDALMADGIEEVDIFLVFLTKEYLQKVHEAVRNGSTVDNCAKEWRCAVARNKRILPVVLDPDLLQTALWPPGVVTLHLAGTLYVDGTDPLTVCDRIHTMLTAFGMSPLPPRRFSLPLVLAAAQGRSSSYSSRCSSPVARLSYSSSLRRLPSLTPQRQRPHPPSPPAGNVTPRFSYGCNILPRRLSGGRGRRRSTAVM